MCCSSSRERAETSQKILKSSPITVSKSLESRQHPSNPRLPIRRCRRRGVAFPTRSRSCYLGIFKGKRAEFNFNIHSCQEFSCRLLAACDRTLPCSNRSPGPLTVTAKDFLMEGSRDSLLRGHRKFENLVDGNMGTTSGAVWLSTKTLLSTGKDMDYLDSCPQSCIACESRRRR